MKMVSTMVNGPSTMKTATKKKKGHYRMVTHMTNGSFIMKRVKKPKRAYLVKA